MKITQSVITLLMSVLTGVAVSMAAEPTDTLRLSREECVAIALQESPTIKVADLEVKRMDYSKKEVLANLFPAIDFSGAYQRTIELQTVSMNSQTFKMGTDNTWNFGFEATMPIINAALWKSISLSDTQILKTLEESRASRLDLVNNINKAYYALMLAIDSRKVVKQNYDLAVFNADIYKKKFDQGTASEYDVLRSSVQVSNIEPELLQTDIAVKQCELQLKILMGIDATACVMPNVTLSDMKRDMYGYALGRDVTLRENTSLRQMDIAQKLAKQNVTVQKMAWVPTLGVKYNMNWMAMNNGNALKNLTFNPYSNVSLGLTVPIFSGGSKFSKVRQAEIQVKELELQRQDLEKSLNMQVELALDNIDKEVKQIKSSEEGMRQASKALEIMQKSFEVGAATYVNLRDSEMANTTAQLGFLQSIYNYLVSTSELDTLLGREEALGITGTTTSK